MLRPALLAALLALPLAPIAAAECASVDAENGACALDETRGETPFSTHRRDDLAAVTLHQTAAGNDVDARAGLTQWHDAYVWRQWNNKTFATGFVGVQSARGDAASASWHATATTVDYESGGEMRHVRDAMLIPSASVRTAEAGTRTLTLVTSADERDAGEAPTECRRAAYATIQDDAGATFVPVADGSCAPALP